MATVDVLAGLLAYSWKGVAFPSAGFRIRLRQDLAMHEYAERDGAHIEGTGRAPLEFSARIPFRNGIELAPSEAAVKQPIYPTAFRDFFDACADRSTGDMVHPEFGRIKCKLQDVDVSYDPNRRDGVDVEVVWIEATDKPSDLLDILSAPSPAQQIAASANDADAAIDAALAALKSKNSTTDSVVRAYLEDLKKTSLTSGSLGDLARKLQSIGDQTDLIQRQAAGAVASLDFRARNIADSLDRAQSHPVYWPLQEAAMRIQAAAADLKSSVSTKNRQLGIYVVAADTTPASIAQDIPAPLGDLLQLNPALAGGPVVLSGARVRYYLNAA